MTDDKNDKKDQSDKSKIVVDDDWKAQAQAEKEKLDSQPDDKPQPAAEEQQAKGPRKLPPASFSTLVSSLATQAILAMGQMRDPKTKKPIIDMDLAKHHIDTLAMLEEKAKGNMTDEESKLLDQAIYQVRMQYVQFAQGNVNMP